MRTAPAEAAAPVYISDGVVGGASVGVAQQIADQRQPRGSQADAGEGQLPLGADDEVDRVEEERDELRVVGSRRLDATKRSRSSEQILERST